MNDFDFLIGAWTVANRRLRTLFADSDERDVFGSTTTCQKILGGGGQPSP